MKTDSNRMGLMQYISAIYVAIIVGVFPLVYHDYYFDMLVTKYKFYYIVTIVFLAAMLITAIVMSYKNKTALNGIQWKKLFDLPELAMLGFLFIAVISTLQSDFKFEAFWGNEGRLTGCFLLLLYGSSVIVVAKTLKLKRWMLDLFLFTGMLACIFGITDYFQMDILGFKVDMVPEQYNMFASTIGNVNSYTSYVALVMGAAAVLFVCEKVVWKAFIYYVCLVIAFFAILMGLSDNAYLALGALFAFLPLYLFDKKTGVKRYFVILATFSGVIYGIDLINRTMADRVLKMDGILQKLSGFSKLEYVVAALVILCVIIYAAMHFSKNKEEKLGHKLQLVWLGICVLGFLVVLFVLFDANIAGNAERYGSIGNYLVFNDDWGTHRGYNWRIGMENYMNFPLIHKIFGFGPDTYGLITYYGNFSEMVSKYQEIYDSAHNEYLQYFITMGPFSLICYITFLVSAGVKMVKKAGNNPCVMAAFFAVLCFAVQAVVNISVPIVAPIMFTFLAMGLAGARED